MQSATVDSHAASLREIAGMLRDVTGEGGEWAAAIHPESRLEEDLWLDSVEIVALAALLRERYGERVDLARHLAGLEFEALVALRVADLLALVRGEHGKA
jgi:acyl carrier protein